ncbi:MAG: hypothetical protein ABIK38_03970 [candidate division WOR-3 bacterium]
MECQTLQPVCAGLTPDSADRNRGGQTSARGGGNCGQGRDFGGVIM